MGSGGRNRRKRVRGIMPEATRDSKRPSVYNLRRYSRIAAIMISEELSGLATIVLTLPRYGKLRSSPDLTPRTTTMGLRYSLAANSSILHQGRDPYSSDCHASTV